MQTLYVHDVPDALYDRLRELAQANHRSISTQVTLLLDQAVEAQRQEQTRILTEIRQRRLTPPPTAPDSLEILREDRER